MSRWRQALPRPSRAAAKAPATPAATVEGTPAGAAGWRAVVWPTALTLGAVTVLAVGALQRLPVTVVALAATAALVTIIRGAIAFLAIRRLALARRPAHVDDLTGLTNRAGFVAALRSALGEAGPVPAQGCRLAAAAPERQFALLVIGLDRFQLVNDGLGHQAGDEVLIAASRRVAATLCPAAAVVARLGGDEFAVLLAGVDGPAARRAGRRARAVLTATPYSVGSLRVPVSASVGVALYPDHATDADGLLQRANAALGTAKRRRSGIEEYQPASDDGPLELSLIESLRVGLREDQIEVHFQPKVDLATGQVRAVEALARWRHPARGLLPPRTFVPLAEHAGLMPALTTLMLDRSCAQAARWRDAGLDVTVAVNVSATDLLDLAFTEQVRSVLAAHGLRPGSLELELTETTLMHDRARAAAVLHALHDDGVAIAVDDFGTGYSALGYLGGHFPVDVLKLDRTFVGRLDHDDDARAIVRSTVELAHDLRLRVVAEGVETRRSLELLRQFGCDAAQGYLVGEPVPADTLTRWLEPAATLTVTRR
ncbi:MAG: bifunctional diguanylate cyclase/phosphodiesterase [Frankia sp.]|nr:bifunctional diguanylate cyclase/phosphodiesterase [Frankia sp.]